MIAIRGMVNRVFGTRFERSMKKLQPIIDEIHGHEERLASVGDDELVAQTQRFRERIGERVGGHEERFEDLRAERRHSEDPAKRESLTLSMAEAEAQLSEATQDVLDEILPEAFAPASR
jgi:preprotein translocase subunit SecA